MVEITAYQSSMFDTLTAMLESNDFQGLETISPETLPKVGVLAHEGATPIAIGFLRMVEGGYVQLDTLVTNKDLSPIMRHEGLTAVMAYLVDLAKKAQAKAIMGVSREESVIMRAEALGFKVLPHTFLVLPLV